MNIFRLALALSALPVSARANGLIAELEAPQSVVAGKEATIRIVPSKIVGSDAAYRFGSEARQAYLFFPPGTGTRSVEGSMPKDGRAYALWMRIGGAGCEVRVGAPPSLGWKDAGTPKDAPRWVMAIPADKLPEGAKWSLAMPKNIEGVITGAIACADPRFEPAGAIAEPNVFTWRTNASSVGKHEFIASVSSGGKEDTAIVAIEVTAAPHKEASPGKEEALAIDLAAAANIEAFPGDTRLQTLGGDLKGQSELNFDGLPVTLRASGPSFLAVAKGDGSQAKAEIAQAESVVKNIPSELPASLDLPLDLKAKRLSFLHCARGSAGQLMETLFEYVVRYEDGTEAVIPVRDGERVAGQLKDYRLTQGWLATSNLIAGITVNVFLSSWENPAPEKPLKSLTMRAKAGGHVYILLAMAAGGAKTEVTDAAPSSQACATVDFQMPSGEFHPSLTSLNLPYVYNQQPPRDVAYFEALSLLAPPLVRIWNHYYPAPHAYANFDATACDAMLKNVFERVLKASPKTRVLLNLRMPDDKQATEAEWEAVATWSLALLRHLREELKLPIDYVELFNEELINHPVASRQAHYRFYNLVAAKLRSGCPGLQVGGTAECWPDAGIIDEFMANCAPDVDFISWHFYPTGTPATPFQELLERSDRFAHFSNKIKEVAARRAPGRTIPQMLTEYNMNYSSWRPVDNRLAKGYAPIWAVAVLRDNIVSGALSGAFYWHFADGGSYGTIAGGATRPAGTLFHLLNTRLAGAKSFAAVTDNQKLAALALESSSWWMVAFVNKSAAPLTVSLETLNLRWPKPANQFERPIETFAISGEDTDFTVEKLRVPPATWTMTLPPLSLRMLFIPKP